MHTYGLGIDIGDATVVAAVCREAAGTAEPVQLGAGTAAGPAVVRVDPKGRRTAPASLADLPADAHVVDHLLDRVGSTGSDAAPELPASPADLLATVIARAHRVAARQEGGPAAWAVLAVPPSWDDARRDQLRDALQAAGLPASSIVSTAVAAARHDMAAGRLEAGATAAVYDLGARSLDVSVVGTARNGLVEHIGVPPQPFPWGGRDVDDAVLALVAGELESGGAQLPADPADLAAVRRACVLAKETLSTQQSASVEVPLPDGPRTVRLTRTDLERALAPALAGTVEALRGAVSAAGLSVAEVDAVVLAGGSARLPVVAETLTAALGRPLVVAPEPALSAALGAARLAVDELGSGVTASAPEPEQVAWVPVMPRDPAARRLPATTHPGDRPDLVGPASTQGRTRRLTQTTAVVLAACVGVGFATTVLAAVRSSGDDPALSLPASGLDRDRGPAPSGQAAAPTTGAEPSEAPVEVQAPQATPTDVAVPLLPTPVELGTTTRSQFLAAGSPLAVFTPAGGQRVTFAGLATSGPAPSSTPPSAAPRPVTLFPPAAPGTTAPPPPTTAPGTTAPPPVTTPTPTTPAPTTPAPTTPAPTTQAPPPTTQAPPTTPAPPPTTQAPPPTTQAPPTTPAPPPTTQAPPPTTQAPPPTTEAPPTTPAPLTQPPAVTTPQSVPSSPQTLTAGPETSTGTSTAPAETSVSVQALGLLSVPLF